MPAGKVWHDLAVRAQKDGTNFTASAHEWREIEFLSASAARIEFSAMPERFLPVVAAARKLIRAIPLEQERNNDRTNATTGTTR